jgi:hypothetical protein
MIKFPLTAEVPPSRTFDDRRIYDADDRFIATVGPNSSSLNPTSRLQ